MATKLCGLAKLAGLERPGCGREAPLVHRLLPVPVSAGPIPTLVGALGRMRLTSLTPNVKDLQVAVHGETILGRDCGSRPFLGVKCIQISREQVKIKWGADGTLELTNRGIGVVRVRGASGSGKRGKGKLKDRLKQGETRSLHPNDIIQLLSFRRSCECPPKTPCVCAGGEGDHEEVVAEWRMPERKEEAPALAGAPAPAPALVGAPAPVAIPDDEAVAPTAAVAANAGTSGTAPAASLTSEVAVYPGSAPLSCDQGAVAPSSVDQSAFSQREPHRWQGRHGLREQPVHETGTAKPRALVASQPAELAASAGSELGASRGASEKVGSAKEGRSTGTGSSALQDRIQQALGLVSELQAAMPTYAPPRVHETLSQLGRCLHAAADEAGPTAAAAAGASGAGGKEAASAGEATWALGKAPKAAGHDVGHEIFAGRGAEHACKVEADQPFTTVSDHARRSEASARAAPAERAPLTCQRAPNAKPQSPPLECMPSEPAHCFRSSAPAPSHGGDALRSSAPAPSHGDDAFLEVDRRSASEYASSNGWVACDRCQKWRPRPDDWPAHESEEEEGGSQSDSEVRMHVHARTRVHAEEEEEEASQSDSEAAPATRTCICTHAFRCTCALAYMHARIRMHVYACICTGRLCQARLGQARRRRAGHQPWTRTLWPFDAWLPLRSSSLSSQQTGARVALRG